MASGSASPEYIDKIAVVDSRVRERGWSLAIAQQLAKDLGVSERTVHRYWQTAQRWTRRTMNVGDTAAWRARQLQLADEAARAAYADKDYSAAAKLLQVGVSLAGTAIPTKVDISHTHTLVNPATVQQMSALSVDELRAIVAGKGEQPPVVEAEFEEAGADRPPRSAQ